MISYFDILDQYIQMREGNCSRELADMSIIKELYKELEKERELNKKLKAENKALKATLAAMKAAQPINNTFNLPNGDYIANQTITQLPK